MAINIQQYDKIKAIGFFILLISAVTTVRITSQHENYEDIETMIHMDFKEGFTMCMQSG